MTFLWTDRCFLSVLFISFVVLLFSLQKAHIRQSFKQVFSKPIANSAGIVLLFFLAIGILDSIHVATPSSQRINNQDSSLLDLILAPLGDTVEKTYSAPLALRLFASETVLIDGKTEQVYPRLRYLSPTIKTAADRDKRLLWLSCKALLASLIITLLICTLAVLIRRGFLPAKPRKAGTYHLGPFFTLFICIFFVCASYWISREFHLFGTGKIGQDIYYYTIKSIRTGLVIGILTTLFMLPLALILGISAGYFGGMIDDVIQYLYTTLSSIPGVLLITASVLSMQTYIANHPDVFNTLSKTADARLLALCLILGVTSWTSLCRLLRAEALKLREVDYVQAAKALGSGPIRILYKHLLPNVFPLVMITLALDFSFLILAEAVLSYVGVGVSSMTISFGNMINGARMELAREPMVWWPMMSAIFFMFILVLASNLVTDALRDAFDPHHS